MKPCPRCGKMISDKATKCPQCGLDVNNISSTGNSQDPQNINRPPVNEWSSQQGQPPFIEPPRKSKKGLWIGLIILLAVGIGAAIWIPVYRHNEKLKAEQLAIIEQHRRDSIAAVEAELARLEQQRLDSIRNNFVSPDLSFFELHGPVKSVEGHINEIGSHPNEEKKKIEFDKNGQLIIESSGSFNSQYCGKIGWKMSRDNEGQIISFTYNSYDGLNCFPNSIKFQWANNKIVKKDIYAFYSNSHIKCEYNSDGFLEKEIWDLREEEKFDDDPDFVTKKITDYKFDEIGNWVSRKVDTKTQTRKITYYED